MADDATKVIAVVGGAALLGLGAWYIMKAPPGHKQPGDIVTARIKFRYQGPANTVWVGFGLSPMAIIGRGTIQVWYHQPVDLPANATFQFFAAPELKAKLPELPPGEYDAGLFIQTVNGEISESATFLAWAWKNKAVTID